MIKAVKMIGKLLLAIAALPVLAYLVLIAINWSDRPPSAATLKFREIVAARAAVPDADNAFVYMLGFSTAADQDPKLIGARRREWLEQVVPVRYDRKDDPLEPSIELRDGGAPGVKQLAEVCRDSDQQACADRFESLAHDWRPTDLDALAIARYAQLLELHAWREIVPLDVSAPLPGYADVLYGQRASMLSLRHITESGDQIAIGEFLKADFALWRTAQRDSDSMIGKMLAIAALRNHFFFSNLILRRLPADRQLATAPAGWQLEFSRSERSLLRVMAGETLFVEQTMRDYKKGKETPYLVDDDLEVRGFVGRALLELGHPLFQLQQETNYIADGNMTMAAAFDVPLGRYQAAKVSIENSPRQGSTWHLYDLTGDVFRIESAASSMEGYPFRVGSLEGMRRAALLTTQLRSRSVPAQKVADELRSAPLTDPYSNAPFQWNVEHQSVVFTGPEDHRWRSQEYLY
jgi:hypothetical protein